MFKEIIVVEGLHDVQKLQSIDPSIECIFTNGSEISPKTIELIKQAQQTRGVILFMDPDFPGRKITQTIMDLVPDVKVAFIEKKKTISKNGKKVGIEHASKADILEALSHFHSIDESRKVPVITMTELYQLGLCGQPHSFDSRAKVSQALHLPPTNAKTLLKWLNMLRISLSQVKEVLL